MKTPVLERSFAEAARAILFITLCKLYMRVHYAAKLLP